MVILIIVLVLIGAFVTLAALGQIDVNFDRIRARIFGTEPQQRAAAPEQEIELQPGEVFAFLAVQNVPAYSAISRDHVYRTDSQGRIRLMRVPVNPNNLPSPPITDPAKVFGRVLAYDKTYGTIFTEADFLPVGTRPGLVAGVPEGKRAMIIDASRINGVHGFNRGDHVDLVATVSLDLSKQLKSSRSVSVNVVSGLSGSEKQVVLHTLVSDGVIVRPVHTREGDARGRRSEQIVIAVAPHEVARVTEALSMGAEIVCIARSGRPGDPDDDAGYESAELGGGVVTTVETIVGSERSVTVLPRSK